MKFLYLFFLNLTLISFSHGQNKQIVGTIKTEGNTKIHFANVILFKVSNKTFVSSTVSNLEGYFEIEKAPMDSLVYLEIRSLGYKIFTSKPFKIKNLDGEFNIFLKKDVLKASMGIP